MGKVGEERVPRQFLMLVICTVKLLYVQCFIVI